MRAHRPQLAAAKAGSALLLVLIGMTVVVGVAAATLGFTLERNNETNLRIAEARALSTAESGFKEAYLEMLTKARDAAEAEDPLVLGNKLVFQGEYEWGAYRVLATRIPGTEDWIMTSTGRVDAAGRGEIYRAVRIGVRAVIGTTTRSKFGFAMFSDQTLSMTGIQFTDSFDSRKGPYSPLPAEAPFSVPYQGTNASVASNGNIIVTGGASELHGDVQPGANGGVADVGGTVDGEIKNLKKPIVLDPIPEDEAQAARLHNDNASIVTKGTGSAYNPATMMLDVSSKQQAVLGDPTGVVKTYYFKGVHTSGSGNKIDIIGPTVIYLDGDWTQNGSGVTNHMGKPTDLLIFGIGTGTLEINGSSTFGAGIYAPDHNLTVNGSGVLKGAFTAEQITRHGTSAFHFDEALIEMGEIPGDDFVAGYLLNGWAEAPGKESWYEAVGSE